jgi:hypothetical protein
MAARRQAGAVALAALMAALIGAVSAKKPQVLLSSLNPPALNVTAAPSGKGACPCAPCLIPSSLRLHPVRVI